MNILRRAGTSLRDMDDAYSAKIGQLYEGANPAVQAAASMVGGAHPSLRKGEVDRQIGPETRMQQIGRNAIEYGLPAMNAVPKYVLPAAGVTAAGQGLMALAQMMSPDQQSSGTVMP